MANERGLQLANGLQRGGAVAQVTLDDRDAGGHVFTFPGREIVQHRYLEASLQGLLDHMTADETGTTRDQHAHGAPV